MLIIYAICKADLATPASAQLTSSAVVGRVVRFTISSCQFVIAFVALTVKLCVDCKYFLCLCWFFVFRGTKKAKKLAQ